MPVSTPPKALCISIPADSTRGDWTRYPGAHPAGAAVRLYLMIPMGRTLRTLTTIVSSPSQRAVRVPLPSNTLPHSRNKSIPPDTRVVGNKMNYSESGVEDGAKIGASAAGSEGRFTRQRRGCLTCRQRSVSPSHSTSRTGTDFHFGV